MKVLVVDDMPPNRKLLGRVLAGWGHEVIEADRGSAAVNRCHEVMPDLILMDVMMPGMSGMEAANLIRQLPAGDEPSIIFVTALREHEGLIPALESGGDDYVTKPVDLEVLAAKIKAHQRIRELSRQLAAQNALLQRRNNELRREHELIEHFFDRIQQRNFMPPDMLRFRASSASAFSGDLLLSAARPGGGLYLLVGDFTGHGLTAAMGSLPVAEVFARLTAQAQPIGVVARRINQLLTTYLPTEIFLAATLLELDATGTLLQYWAGGLPNGVALSTDGDIKSLASQHMPLGILDDGEFDESVRSLKLPCDTRIMLMTDGITESASPAQEHFGEQRTLDVLAGVGPDDDALTILLDAVTAFTGTAQLQDDVVLAQLTCRPLAPGGRGASDGDGGNYPTHISFTVSAGELADGGITQRAVDLLCISPVAERHRAELHTILSELISNAIDHGLLCIDEDERDYADQGYQYRRTARLRALMDASLTISADILRTSPTWTARISVEHSGAPRPVLVQVGDEEAASGRGLLILDALCDAVQIAPDGRRTQISYTFD